MTEPVTTLKTLIVPNTGDLTGAWGTSAMNPNFQLIDTMFGGVATISLGAATSITLSVPATTGVWAGTNPQSSQAMIRFTGTQSGDATITFTLPGFYIIDNKCTPSDFLVSCTPAAAGFTVCAPPGRKTTIFYDGTDIDYVDLGIPGESLDLHGWTATPRWITNSFPQPYLLKNGSSHSTATYPHLAYALAGAFGNTNPVGVSFFCPDEMARARIAYDALDTGRLTLASGMSGTTMGSAGGNQLMQSHQHANTLNDPGHRHGGGDSSAGANIIVNGGSAQPFIINGNTTTATTGIGITNATTGAGGSQNVQPSIVSFLPLLKT